MTNQEIKERITFLNAMLEKSFTPDFFTLNVKTEEILTEIESIQANCPHNFINGICEYCEAEENTDGNY